MYKLINVIKERRSIRKYLHRSVPKKVIREILEAARWAPSAHNAQPFRFIVLTKPQAKHQLAVAMAQAWVLDPKKTIITQYTVWHPQMPRLNDLQKRPYL